MAEVTLYKVPSGTYTNEGNSYAGAEWYISWTETYITNGKTKINWGLYKRGRTVSPTWLMTSVKLEIKSNNTITDYTNLSWESGIINANPTANPSKHYSFNPKDNTNPTASGSFVISHDDNGNASFWITGNASVYVSAKTNYTSVTQTVTKNLPITRCYWGTNAAVRIDKSIQAPGQNITISWSGHNAGVANEIAGFSVYYSLNSNQSWNEISSSIAKNQTSITFQVPEDRGKTISAKVIIKGSVSGYDSVEKLGGSCKINTLPDKPSISGDLTTIIPSTQETISFTIVVGADEDGQTCSIKYSTSPSKLESKDYVSGSNISIDTNTTYYFWTYDGLEYSEDYIDKIVLRNSKPTVELSIQQDGNFNQILTANAGSNGQDNNSYSFGYKYNDNEYNLLLNSKQNFLEIGDIRSDLSNKLNGLNQGESYTIEYWTQRNDGIETSEKEYQTESFTIPTLSLDNKGTLQGYFGTIVEVKVGTSAEDVTSEYEGYYPLGERQFDDVARGSQLTQISFRRDTESSQYFKINLNEATKLTRVYAFDFNILDISSEFKPYSTPTKTFSISARDETYGFSNQPILNYNNIEVGIIPASNDNVWSYFFDPSHLWGENGLATSVVSEGIARKSIDLSVTNIFGESFKKTCELVFNFQEPPVIEDFELKANNISLSDFDYIKEGVPIKSSGRIAYYDKKVNFKIINDFTGLTIYEGADLKESFNKEPWIKNESDGWVKNPYHTILTNILDTPTLPETSISYETSFTIIATSGEESASSQTEKVKVQRHVPAQIRFLTLNYANGELSGTFQIDDFGYDSNTNGTVESIYLYDNEDLEIWNKNTSNSMLKTNEPIEFSIEYGNFDETYRSLAPICKTTLEAKYPSFEGENFIFSTSKITNILNYLIVYNILPTVAYRQNCIGINTNNPTKDGNIELENPVLTLSGYNNNKNIYLAFGGHIASIDLLTGTLSNFVVDAGTWD